MKSSVTIDTAVAIPDSHHDIHQPQNRLRLQKDIWFLTKQRHSDQFSQRHDLRWQSYH